MQLFEEKKSDGQWTRAGFLRQFFSKNELFSKILAFLESAQWADWKNGLIFEIWSTFIFGLVKLEMPNFDFFILAKITKKT